MTNNNTTNNVHNNEVTEKTPDEMKSTNIQEEVQNKAADKAAEVAQKTVKTFISEVSEHLDLYSDVPCSFKVTVTVAASGRLADWDMNCDVTVNAAASNGAGRRVK